MKERGGHAPNDYHRFHFRRSSCGTHSRRASRTIITVLPPDPMQPLDPQNPICLPDHKQWEAKYFDTAEKLVTLLKKTDDQKRADAVSESLWGGAWAWAWAWAMAWAWARAWAWHGRGQRNSHQPPLFPAGMPRFSEKHGASPMMSEGLDLVPELSSHPEPCATPNLQSPTPPSMEMSNKVAIPKEVVCLDAGVWFRWLPGLDVHSNCATNSCCFVRVPDYQETCICTIKFARFPQWLARRTHGLWFLLLQSRPVFSTASSRGLILHNSCTVVWFHWVQKTHYPDHKSEC